MQRQATEIGETRCFLSCVGPPHCSLTRFEQTRKYVGDTHLVIAPDAEVPSKTQFPRMHRAFW